MDDLKSTRKPDVNVMGILIILCLLIVQDFRVLVLAPSSLYFINTHISTQMLNKFIT